LPDIFSLFSIHLYRDVSANPGNFDQAALLEACRKAPAPAAKIPEESKTASKESLQEKCNRLEIENAKLISVTNEPIVCSFSLF
jgi:hypothetical protein